MHPIALGLGAAAVSAAALVALVLSRSRRPSIEPWRARLITCAQRHVLARTPYEWGGGHGRPGYGLDCSGLVLQCAKQAEVEVWLNADGMYKQLPEVEVPQTGDLALYGQPGHASHVRLVERWNPAELRAECIGAEGGGPHTTSPEVAMMQHAYVRRIADHRDRKDFLGFRTLADRPRSSAAQSAVVYSPPG